MKVHYLETQWEERTKWERTPFLLSTTQSLFTSKTSDQLMYLPIVRVKLKGPNLWQGWAMKRKIAGMVGVSQMRPSEKSSAKEHRFKKMFSSSFQLLPKYTFKWLKTNLGRESEEFHHIFRALYFTVLFKINLQGSTWSIPQAAVTKLFITFSSIFKNRNMCLLPTSCELWPLTVWVPTMRLQF